MNTLLVIIDGLGLRQEKQGNAFNQAETPNLDQLMEENGYQELEASGPAVGLPEGYTGNSEVGHLHLGSGRTIPQRLTRINEAIQNNRLKEKEAVKNAFQTAETQNTDIHLAGILSDGGIHGHIKHLKALLVIGSDYDVDIKIHCFTDGRDVPPKSAEKYISEIENFCETTGGEIVSVMGRFYSMDRDQNWGRTQQAYNAMTQGEGFQFEEPREAVEKAYNEDENDYFIQPSTHKNYNGINGDDQIIFYNYRADRERQITQALTQKEEEFQRFENPVNPDFTSMFPYKKEFDNQTIFNKQKVQNTLGEKIAEQGMTQLRVAESQKKPHVTYFFNGQRELKFKGETRKFIESDKIRSFDEKPEMHAQQLTDTVIQAIEKGEKDFILLNYANADLVGHTGKLEPTIEAIETIDQQIGQLNQAIQNSNYSMIITSDHGNSENLGTSKNPNTSHTMNKVPLIPVQTELDSMEKIADLKQEILKNI